MKVEFYGRKEIWEQVDLYCPTCGSKPVWQEQTDDDYYIGKDHLCTKCETVFNVPHIRKIAPSSRVDTGRLFWLKEEDPS